MAVVEVNPRVTYTQSVLGVHRYVFFYYYTCHDILTPAQAKGGYKTRRKRNPNKYLVQDRERNQGKRKTNK